MRQVHREKHSIQCEKCKDEYKHIIEAPDVEEDTEDDGK